MCKRIEQRRFSGVGVAHERDIQYRTANPRLALHTSLPLQPDQTLLEQLVIGQTGQRIVIGFETQTLLLVADLCDVIGQNHQTVVISLFILLGVETHLYPFMLMGTGTEGEFDAIGELVVAMMAEGA